MSVVSSGLRVCKVTLWHVYAVRGRKRRCSSNAFAASVVDFVGAQYHAPAVLPSENTRCLLYGTPGGDRGVSGGARDQSGFNPQSV